MEACWTAVGVEDVCSAGGTGDGAEGSVRAVGRAEEGKEVEFGRYGSRVEDEDGEVGSWEVAGLGSR